MLVSTELNLAMSLGATLLFLLLTAAAAAGGVALLACRHEIGRARAELEAGGQVANTSAGPIEYAEKGTGAPLLSIHGAGGGYDHGLAIVAELLGTGFRVIAPSRFGYLRTPMPTDTSAASQADAHVALLDVLQIDRVVVVGISAGARSAIELAIRHPQRVAALILMVPGTYAPGNPVAVEGSRASGLVLWLVNTGADFAWWALEKIAPSILVRFIGVDPQLVAVVPPPEQARVLRIVRSIKPLSLRFAGINIDSNPDRSRPALEQIAARTLIIAARDDLFNTLPAAEFAARTISGAKLVVYDTGGHLLVGQQAQVRAVVADFLDKYAHASARSG
jgi:pimeloyl-ACP methyl ester carboxylesterase